MNRLWDWLNKAFGWLGESNRLAHLYGVFVLSGILGWAAGATAIVTAEAKDVQSGGWRCWDWLDCAAGAIGCALGGAIHWAIFKHW